MKRARKTPEEIKAKIAEYELELSQTTDSHRRNNLRRYIYIYKHYDEYREKDNRARREKRRLKYPNGKPKTRTPKEILNLKKMTMLEFEDTGFHIFKSDLELELTYSNYKDNKKFFAYNPYIKGGQE